MSTTFLVEQIECKNKVLSVLIYAPRREAAKAQSERRIKAGKP
jgi:hypothetical protein